LQNVTDRRKDIWHSSIELLCSQTHPQPDNTEKPYHLW